MTSKERKALEALMGITLKDFLKEVKKVGYSGRDWGINGSKFVGSHVTLGVENEVVSTFVKDGKIHILEYKKTTGTELGDKVRKILKAKSLPIAE
jgi:hypothetical protein